MAPKDFRRQKIESLTLGERLALLRKEHHVTINEFVKHTRIQKKYVDALESGLYDELPSAVYVRGFIYAYEAYFSLPKRSLVKIFEREYQIYENMSASETPDDAFGSRVQIPRVIITPRLLIAGISILAICGIGFYVYSGVEKFVSAPWIDVDTPRNGQRIDAPTVMISGTTHPEAFLYLNNELLAVDVDGSFSRDINLISGENVILLRSENTSGKETQSKLVVISTYEPDVSEVQEAVIYDRETVTLELEALERVWVSVRTDDVSVFNETLEPGQKQSFEAGDQIVVTAGVGNALRVVHNSAEERLLSENDQIVRDVVFGRGDPSEDEDAISDETENSEKIFTEDGENG